MKLKTFQFLPALMLALMLLSATAQPAIVAASTRSNIPEQKATPPTNPVDPQELEGLLDELLETEMAAAHVPGAMVAVVQDGNLLLAKGYGYANLENQTPVDPQHTLFRVGSVSKLFVWTAVMQLLEQGKLSLDTDVNEYLDFAIPATYPQPITMGHLLSHTAGFEDKGTDMHRLQDEQMSTLETYVKDNLPARAFPTGETVSYSNYGTALAGYIVECISGLSFNDYVEQNIFTPIGMTHSTFRQPLPDNLAENMAAGYGYADEQYVPGSFVFNQSYPVGAMSASAADMARFMMAHLQNGELDGQRILQEATAIQMHSQLYTSDPRLNGGMAYGFFEKNFYGQRVISHGGNLFNFMSGLYLIPDQNLGFFISTNGTQGAAVVNAVTDAFFSHYYPVAESSDLQSVDGFAARIDPYLGEYTPARSNFTTSEKIYSLTTRPMVSLDNDGFLIISYLGQEQRFAEIEPGLLQAVDDPSVQWVYRSGSDGRKYLQGTARLYEPLTLFKTPWYGTRTLHMLMFLICTLLFLGAMIAWPARFFAGWRGGAATSQPVAMPARLARWTAALFGLLWLASLLGIASIFADILPGFGIPRIVFEVPPVMNIVLAMAYVLGGLALAMPFFAALAWVRRYWSPGGRVFYSLLALLGLLLTWSLVYWNLLL